MDFLEGVGRSRSVDDAEFVSWMRLGRRSLNGNERNALLIHRGVDTTGLPRYRDEGYVQNADRIEDGRSVAAFDCDQDGDVDLVVQNSEAEPRLLINQGMVGHSITVDLVGTLSNRDAVGAAVEVRCGDRTQRREVRLSAGYLCGCSPRLHFGIGEAPRVDELIVHWPSGLRTRRAVIPAGTRLRIVEAKSR